MKSYSSGQLLYTSQFTIHWPIKQFPCTSIAWWKVNYFGDAITPRRWNINSEFEYGTLALSWPFMSACKELSWCHHRSLPPLFPLLLQAPFTFISLCFCEPLKLTMAPLRQSYKYACLSAFPSWRFGASLIRPGSEHRQSSQNSAVTLLRAACLLKWS